MIIFQTGNRSEQRKRLEGFGRAIKKEQIVYNKRRQTTMKRRKEQDNKNKKRRQCTIVTSPKA